jgi:hypothetical protein
MRKLRGSSRRYQVARMPAVNRLAEINIGREGMIVVSAGRAFVKYMDARSANALYNAARSAVGSGNLILNGGLDKAVAIAAEEGKLLLGIAHEGKAQFLVAECQLVAA